jgi:hypothetical protein
MRRRAFIAALGGAAAWPMMARAQRSDRMRRLGVLMSFASDDPEGQARVAALRGGLEALGWVEGKIFGSTIAGRPGHPRCSKPPHRNWSNKCLTRSWSAARRIPSH